MCGHLRRLVRRTRRHWPQTHITIRGDGHYCRPQVMAWCEENGIDFVFGLPGNAVLADAVEETADDIRTAPSIINLACGASRRPVIKLSPGTKDIAPAPESRPQRRGSISVLSSPVSRPDRPSIFYEAVYCARG